MIVGAKGLLEDRTVQIDVFADELGGDPGRVPIGAQHGRSRFIRPKRASSVNMMRSSRPRRAAARRALLTASGKPVF